MQVLGKNQPVPSPIQTQQTLPASGRQFGLFGVDANRPLTSWCFGDEPIQNPTRLLQQLHP